MWDRCRLWQCVQQLVFPVLHEIFSKTFFWIFRGSIWTFITHTPYFRGKSQCRGERRGLFEIGPYPADTCTPPHTHTHTPLHNNTLQRTSVSSSGLAQCQSSNRWVFITVSCATVPDSPNKLACAPYCSSGEFMCLMNNKGSGVVCQTVKKQLNSRAEKWSLRFQLCCHDKTQNRRWGCCQPSSFVPSLSVDDFVFPLRNCAAHFDHFTARKRFVEKVRAVL